MVKAVVGANWGDEGKGKITDMLAEHADIVVRFQGGANAGHTIKNHYGKFSLHTLPSGVFYDHTTSIIGNGVALDIHRLFQEIQSITDQGVPKPHILVSDRAQIVMPYHVLLDQYGWAANRLVRPNRALRRFSRINTQKSASRSATCLMKSCL